MAKRRYDLYYTEKENGLLKKLPKHVYTYNLDESLPQRRKILKCGIYTYIKIQRHGNKNYSYLRLHSLFFFDKGSLIRIWDATINGYRPYQYVMMIKNNKLIDFFDEHDKSHSKR